MTHAAKTSQTADFLQFLSDARTFLTENRVSKHHPDVRHIRTGVEDNYRDDRGQPAVYQKFESTLYEDARNLVTLWRFFPEYEKSQLRRYNRLTAMELSGLTGDHHPMAILGRSLLGTAALLMSAISVWWGLISLISADDSGNLFTELLHGLLDPAWINRIVGVIWLAGMYVLIWYVLRMIRNRRQVAFLSSLTRALTLYLDDE
ncbi:hypothetical protein G8764_20035 [Pseudomaricurvus alcaniphilus]|uniref:hypothetical protein n=1 Tax=Pseudomaricurvus alcaniphilus TaxID=1166482 RepID=UPI00140C3129|nr:hypothetical protein [Pseudomaricurvus alcaniphilus]NHN39596.1 hypothetical protein [Pseudomaricurvus alcaniphilus]